MQRFTTRLALAALAVLALTVSRLAIADTYTVTDLGALPDQPYTSIWQQTINNDGMIAAYANANADDIANATFFGDSSFLWKKGTITPLPGLPDAIDTVAFSLNNKGQVVGRSTPLGQRSHAVLWDHGVIQTLGELLGDDKSAALQINDRGQAVGYSRQTVLDGNGLRAVLWDRGRITRLPSLPAGEGWEEALGINEKGQIVGYAGPSPGLEHAALWDKSGVHDLGTLGGDSSEAIAINHKGKVVGYSATASGDLAAVLWNNGVLTDLGVLVGDVGGAAVGINNHGQIVGTSGVTIVNGNAANIFTSHAVLWEKGAIIDLQTRIPANSGWTVTGALGINAHGQIVAQGVYHGNLRAVLLTPVHNDDDDGDGGDD
jgi:probable HAF family extracellular repeat protein